MKERGTRVKRAIAEGGKRVKESFRRDQVYQVIVVRPSDQNTPECIVVGETKHPHISRATAEVSRNVRIKYKDTSRLSPEDQRLEDISSRFAEAMGTFTEAIIATAASLGASMDEVNQALLVGLEAGRTMRGSLTSYIKIQPMAPRSPGR